MRPKLLVAALPGATVTARNLETGFVRAVQQADAAIDYAGTIVSATKMTGTVDYHKGPLAEFTGVKK